MPFNLGVPELIIILVVVLVIFGPGKLPSIGSSLGKGIREFRKATSSDDDKPEPPPPPAPVAAVAPPPAPVAAAAPPSAGPATLPADDKPAK